MNSTDRRLWPFRPRTSIISSIVLLVGLMLIVWALMTKANWPSQESETTILVCVIAFSLVPILLCLVDIIIERGGAFEVAGVKFDFSQVPQMGMSGLTVPVNIGVPGQSVSDSSTTEILDALKQATACDVVIIDLEDGQAWWETRLLVLLAGAVRLKSPEKVVFVGRDGGIEECFQGWGTASKLLRCLLQAHPQYPLSYHRAMAAARQWEMVEPSGVGIIPPQPGWMQPGLATQHEWMAFDNQTGMPNPLLAEQYFANELGNEVESQEKPKTISLVRLDELFRPVLHKVTLDETWSAERQLTEFLNSDSEYLAITQNGKYSTLVSRLTVLNTIVKTLVEKK